ncbi:MAG: Flp family type IVb pilin [Firmicutes bacterium]|nr:Flp family type IVb pilin [Bacillota bacterium]
MSWLRRVLVTALRPLVGPRGVRGVTTAEYALLLALVVIVLISSLTSLGATLQDKLQSIIDTLTGVGP